MKRVHVQEGGDGNGGKRRYVEVVASNRYCAVYIDRKLVDHFMYECADMTPAAAKEFIENQTLERVINEVEAKP